LPDSVRCSADANHTFTCEVDIGPDPAPASSASVSSASAASASTQVVSAGPQQSENPAVSSLVGSYKTVVLPTVDEPYLTASALSSCAGNEASILLALAAKGPLAALAMFKASFDTSKCLALEHNSANAAASLRERADYCSEQGGTVTSVVDNTTYCEVQVGAK
jgi:hypothetical protein